MYLGTLNNPTSHYPEFDLAQYLEAWHTQGKAVFVTGQLEKGESGTPHVQMFLQFAKPGIRITALKKHCKHARFDVVKFNNGADEYCNKEDGRLDGPHTYGIRPARKNLKGDTARRNNEIIAKGAEQAVRDGDIRLESYIQVERAINQIKLKSQVPYCPNHDRGVWIHGPSRTGKSTYARATYPDAYDKIQNKWFDGYAGQKAIILDDLDTDVLGHHLKRWMDVHACNGEVKG